MNLELLDYRLELAKWAFGVVYLPTKEIVEPTSPLSFLADLLNQVEPALLQFFKECPSQEKLYYILMTARECLPAFFPVHDIHLMIANLLRPKMQAGQTLVLLDWELLPAAILAATSDCHINLPSCLGMAPDQGNRAEGIARMLRLYLPEIHWHLTVDAAAHLPDGCVVLGQHPLRHGDRDPRFLDKLTGISSGILYTHWDFLGVKIHAHTRSLWIKSGLIRAVLQLPRPRRQGAAVYPALLLLGSPDPSGVIRLAHIASCDPGPGVLDQQVAVSLLQGGASGKQENALDITHGKQENVLDIAPVALARNGLFDLSPASHLVHQKTLWTPARSGLTLRGCAQILRCQVPRERLTSQELFGLECSAAEFGEELWGEYPDGYFISREISLGELDSLTGFLKESGGNIVRLQLTLLGKQGKYILQSGDIIFAFRGTVASLGQTGFVEEEGHPAITGQALCIIRPLPETDAVWLYYYLQRPAVREWVRGKATGSSLLTINLDSIRDIPIELPGREELDSVNEEHRKIASVMAKVAELRRELRVSLRSIHDIGQLEEAMRNAQHSVPRGRPEQE